MESATVEVYRMNGDVLGSEPSRWSNGAKRRAGRYREYGDRGICRFIMDPVALSGHLACMALETASVVIDVRCVRYVRYVTVVLYKLYV